MRTRLATSFYGLCLYRSKLLNETATQAGTRGRTLATYATRKQPPDHQMRGTLRNNFTY